jgi:hypothetical protein
MLIRACMLPTLAVVASLVGAVGAATHAQAEELPQVCALKENAVIIVIEDHGAAEDVSADRLGDAGLTMLHARSVCYQGRTREALALYESILDLGPVASLHPRR